MNEISSSPRFEVSRSTYGTWLVNGIIGHLRLQVWECTNEVKAKGACEFMSSMDARFRLAGYINKHAEATMSQFVHPKTVEWNVYIQNLYKGTVFAVDEESARDCALYKWGDECPPMFGNLSVSQR